MNLQNYCVLKVHFICINIEQDWPILRKVLFDEKMFWKFSWNVQLQFETLNVVKLFSPKCLLKIKIKEKLPSAVSNAYYTEQVQKIEQDWCCILNNNPVKKTVQYWTSAINKL